MKQQKPLTAEEFTASLLKKPQVEEILSTEISDEDLAEAYTDKYGVKFSPDRKRLLFAPKDLEHYIVPSNVQVICDFAFSNCKNLTEITLSKGLTSIGDSAFSYCEGIEFITFPEGLTNIGNYTFSWCSSLTSITFSEGVISIGDGVFYGCLNLRFITLPEGLRSIGYEIFGRCSHLTSIMLPESLSSIRSNPFAGLKLELRNRSPHFYVEDNILREFGMKIKVSPQDD